MLFYYSFLRRAVLHKDHTAAVIKTCHCDSKRVYAEMNNDGKKNGKREMRGNKNPTEPWGLRDENCILLILLVVSRGGYPVIWQKFR